MNTVSEIPNEFRTWVAFTRAIAFVSAMAIVGCKFTMAPKAPPRIAASDSLIIPESVSFERTGDGTSINLSFETRAAAECKIGFYLNTSTNKSVSNYAPCAGRSATRFTETIQGLSKDRLVSIVIMSWAATADERTGRGLIITESPPKADQESLNLLSVDLGAGRLELSSVSSADRPSGTLSSTLSKIQDSSCGLSDSAQPIFSSPRKSAAVLSATSRGFINVSTAAATPDLVGGSFQIVQRQSTEWSITARTSSGYGQIRLAKPTLLRSVTFAGRDQAAGDDGGLEDVDPPSLKVSSSQTFVASWAVDGSAENAIATLSLAPSGSFKGITCVAPAKVGKITIPSSLIAKLPANERLWASLRLDAWQPIDEARWLVRVSDWKSIGVKRL